MTDTSEAPSFKVGDWVRLRYGEIIWRIQTRSILSNLSWWTRLN